MIATGTGTTPCVGFLRSQVAERPQSRMVVVRGASHQRDLGYCAELSFLRDSFPNFYYLPTLTDANAAWNGYRMWIEEMPASGETWRKRGIALCPKRTHVYLCGNPKMA